jgi:hypothetical protein
MKCKKNFLFKILFFRYDESKSYHKMLVRIQQLNIHKDHYDDKLLEKYVWLEIKRYVHKINNK